MQYKGKIIWITGASSGIGEALAYEFARRGSTLILSARREKQLEEVRKKCLELTTHCHICLMDLGNPGQIEDCTKKVLNQFDRIDVLVNNGGISQRSLIMETPLDIDRKIMEINYFGSVLLTKLVLPVMVKNGGGHVVAISSIVGKFGFPLRSAYSASKHAMVGFFETLKTELNKDNIKVPLS
ncbi:MAG: SDR family NAD(P)-dependent oxidoreductase, partial [Bacteroidota bacterium]